MVVFVHQRVLHHTYVLVQVDIQAQDVSKAMHARVRHVEMVEFVW